MDKVRPVETALLIGILSVVLNLLVPDVRIGSFTLHLSPVDAIFLLVALSSTVFRWEGVKYVLTRNRAYYLLSGLFLSAVLLSALLSPAPLPSLKETFQIAAYLWILPLILAYDPDIPWVYRIGGKVLVLLSALVLLPYFYVLGWARFNPFNLHPNPTGFLFALFSVVLAHYGYTAYSLLSVILTSMTFSRSAMGSLFSAFVLKGAVERGKRAFNFASAIVTVALLFASPYALRGFLNLRTYVNSHVLHTEGYERKYKPPIDVVRGESYEVLRLLMWEATYRMWEKRPLTGIGFGRYREEWKAQCRKGDLPKKVCTKWVENVDPHNLFVQILGETGVLGFLTFSIFLIFLFLRVAGNPLSLTVLIMTLLFSLLQPSPLFTRNLAPLVWLLLFYGGVVRWKGD